MAKMNRFIAAVITRSQGGGLMVGHTLASTVKLAWEYLNTKLLKELDEATLSLHNVSLPISRSTSFQWMKNAEQVDATRKIFTATTSTKNWTLSNTERNKYKRFDSSREECVSGWFYPTTKKSAIWNVGASHPTQQPCH